MKVRLGFDWVTSGTFVGVRRTAIAVAERPRYKARRVLVTGEVGYVSVVAVMAEIVRRPSVYSCAGR